MVGSARGVYSFELIFVSAKTIKRHHHHPALRAKLPLLPPLSSVFLSPVVCTWYSLHVSKDGNTVD
jgi:hypothetical protein